MATSEDRKYLNSVGQLNLEMIKQASALIDNNKKKHWALVMVGYNEK